MDKLNIGCGFEKKEGFINLDKSEYVNPDIICNIEDGIPFSDNYLDYIYSKNVLEHIKPDKWLFVLDEIYRIAKDGCILEFILPFDNILVRNHYDHYRSFTWGTFKQLYSSHNRDYYGKIRIKNIKPEPSKIIQLFFYLFPILKRSITFKFEIIKGCGMKENE